jgi:hypothetical protein
MAYTHFILLPQVQKSDRFLIQSNDLQCRTNFFSAEKNGNLFFWTVCQLLGSYSIGDKMSDVCVHSIGRTILTREDKVHWQQPIPLALCTPQITHGLTRDRTQAPAVRGRWLTTMSEKAHIANILLRLHFNAYTPKDNSRFLCVLLRFISYRAAQLVEVLCYKPEGRGFDPYGIIGIFHWYNLSGHTLALGLT